MDILKKIMAILFRTIVILLPIPVFALWAWDKVPVAISVMATIGVETVYLAIFGFLLVSREAFRNLKDRRAQRLVS